MRNQPLRQNHGKEVRGLGRDGMKRNKREVGKTTNRKREEEEEKIALDVAEGKERDGRGR